MSAKSFFILLFRRLFTAILYHGWPLFRKTLKPDFIFLVYGTRQDKDAYWPKRLEKFFRPVFPVGIIRRGKSWGLIAATTLSVRELLGHEGNLRRLLKDARSEFPNAKVFALAGQLPGFCSRENVSLPPQFVAGIRGTVYAMVSAARHLAEKVGKPAQEINFAVLGAGGTIGVPLIETLRREFGNVIAFDPRYRETPGQDGNVERTFDPLALTKADATLVLTVKGDDVMPYISHFRSGSQVADDTHPCMSAKTIRQLQSLGVNVWKATTEDLKLRMFPRLPNFRNDDTPGCLLEAVVCLLTGIDDRSSQEEFNRSAAKLGFKARLAPHPDV